MTEPTYAPDLTEQELHDLLCGVLLLREMRRRTPGSMKELQEKLQVGLYTVGLEELTL